MRKKAGRCGSANSARVRMLIHSPTRSLSTPSALCEGRVFRLHLSLFTFTATASYLETFRRGLVPQRKTALECALSLEYVLLLYHAEALPAPPE